MVHCVHKSSCLEPFTQFGHMNAELLLPKNM